MKKLKSWLQGLKRPRPAGPREVPVLQESGRRGWFTLGNILMALTAAVVLLAVAQTGSIRAAALAVALLVTAWLLLSEFGRRRRWERGVQAQMKSFAEDNLRLMRDVARQRQEVIFMREALAGAGAAIRQQQTRAGDSENNAEQRMLKTIAGVLAGLSGGYSGDDMPEDALPVPSALDLAIIEHHAESGDLMPTLTDAQVVELVRAAIDQNRIDLFTQPIVTLPQRKPRFVETFSRIRIRRGVYMPAERYVSAARQNDMLPAIDNLLLLRSLQALRMVAESDPARVFFCNITSLTLHDPKFMTDLVEFIAQNRNLAPRLVFELSQHDLDTLGHDVLPVLAGLAHLGCRFSMDQVRTLNFSIEGLTARFIRFVKVDAALLLELLQKEEGRSRLMQFKASLDLEGIDLIVEKIENERQLVELLDIGIDYGQGYLFGMPVSENEGQP
jgi:cyclic-di-GMP phosphodiesterase TipF (flagellum assembly factor)